MKPLWENLKKVPIFSSLGEEHLKELASRTIEKTFKKNQIIFDQGDIGESLFIIVEGAVKISLFDSDSHEFIIETLTNGEIFGEISMLDEGYRTATATAIQDTKSLIMFRKDLISLIKNYPEMALEIITTLTKRLRFSTGRISNLTFYDAYGKVAGCILALVKKSGHAEGDKVVVNMDLTRQELANMAGLSRESFSRILKDFQVRGCIKLDGKKLIVSNVKLLKRETVF